MVQFSSAGKTFSCPGRTRSIKLGRTRYRHSSDIRSGSPHLHHQSTGPTHHETASHFGSRGAITQSSVPELCKMLQFWPPTTSSVLIQSESTAGFLDSPWSRNLKAMVVSLCELEPSVFAFLEGLLPPFYAKKA